LTKLHLPDVTLVMVTSVAHDLSRMALLECIRRADFNSVLVLSDDVKTCPTKLDWCRYHEIPQVDIDQATALYWYKVPKLVETSHFLVIHYDSWIVNPSAWSDAFLECDYVGAPWWYGDKCNVGNGGFSLRSVKMARHVADNVDRYPFSSPEDNALCRIHGEKLIADGFVFAPPGLATTFSFERVPPYDADGVEIRPFGFHGMFNWPEVLTDDQIAERVKMMPADMFASPHFAQMCTLLRLRGRKWDYAKVVQGTRVYVGV
jgi:hypothetical protein